MLLKKIGLLFLMILLLAGAVVLPRFAKEEPIVQEIPEPEAPAEETIAETSPAPEPMGAAVTPPAPRPEEPSTPADTPGSSPESEIDVEPFFAAIDNEDLKKAGQFLSENVDLPTALRASLSRTLSMAEERVETREALARTQEQVTTMEESTAQQMQQTLVELQKTTEAAQQAIREAASLREEMKNSPSVAASGTVAAISQPPGDEPLPEAVTIPFGFDSSSIETTQQEILEDVATTLKERGYLKVELRGFSDRRGASAYNATLSAARAVSVKDELIANGVPSGRISMIPFGETQAGDSTEDPDARRVEIRFEH